MAYFFDIRVSDLSWLLGWHHVRIDSFGLARLHKHLELHLHAWSVSQLLGPLAPLQKEVVRDFCCVIVLEDFAGGGGGGFPGRFFWALLDNNISKICKISNFIVMEFPQEKQRLGIFLRKFSLSPTPSKTQILLIFGALRKGPPFHGSRSSREIDI